MAQRTAPAEALAAALVPRALEQEPAHVRWARRAVSITFVSVGFVALLAAAPALLLVGAVIDLIRGSSWSLVRFVLIGLVYLGCEVAGLVAAFVVWLIGGDEERTADRHYRLQAWWARAIFELGQKIFDVTLTVDGLNEASDGPVLVLIRHASLVDTLLPANLLTAQRGLRLRYVLKQELLWDPCLDVVGQRLPNCFVRRGGADTQTAIAAVKALAMDLGTTEGVLLFPEGTRFAPAKRAKILESLERGDDPEALARARALRHVLPPRLGGVLALLEQAPYVDVVFCAHRGFADVRTFGDLMNGALVHRDVHVRFWRVRSQDIPKDPEGRVAWLYDQWGKVDRFVGEGDIESGAGSS